MSFTLNYNAEDQKNPYGPLDLGTYHVVVTDQEIGTASTGNPQLKLTLTVQDEGEFEGRTVLAFISLTSKAAYFHNLFRAAIGFEPLGTGEIEFEPEDYLEQELRIVTDQYTKGTGPTAKTYTKIDRYLPLNDEEASDGELPWSPTV